ncbi:unnamed protein product [Fusarium graminearum]|nr:unnamed protein product [Fusarium graminearum]
MAAREVVLWCLCYPYESEQWGKRAREKYIAEKLKATKGRRKKRRNMQRSSHIRDNGENNWGYHYDYGYNGDNILRWENIVDWEIWPKSPPSD